MLREGHPGFADPAYRARRSEIASIADSYKQGDLIPEVPYVLQEHEVWQRVSHILQALYPHFACKEYNKCFQNFELWDASIPQFSALNKKLFDYCFSLSPVAGLVPPREFLEALANDTMLCTQYIRHHSVPEYTPEPDVIHEVFGHAVFFLNEDMRKISRLFGRAAQKASDELVEDLIKVYWHTIEFGVCFEGRDESLRAYGAGLLSSVDELSSIRQVPLRNFDIEEMKNTPYDTMNPQPLLFCATDFQQVVRELTAYLTPLS